MKTINLIAVLIAMVIPLTSHADAAKEAIAISMVKSQIELFKTNQPDAISNINTKKQSNSKTHAILVYDFNGKIVAWSFLPTLVGRPAFGLSNSDGPLPVNESITKAAQGKSGWYEISMKNPATGLIGKIKVYYEPINNLVVTSGFFE